MKLDVLASYPGGQAACSMLLRIVEAEVPDETLRK
jgi:hypothetical protein